MTRGVVALYKHETTPDVTTGIELAVRRVLEDAAIDAGSEGILSLTIGTTVCCLLFSLTLCHLLAKFVYTALH